MMTETAKGSDSCHEYTTGQLDFRYWAKSTKDSWQMQDSEQPLVLLMKPVMPPSLLSVPVADKADQFFVMTSLR